jgi:hypothetical protein
MAARRYCGDLESMLRCGHCLGTLRIFMKPRMSCNFRSVLLDFLSNLRTIRRSSEKLNYEEETTMRSIPAISRHLISCAATLRGGLISVTFFASAAIALSAPPAAAASPGQGAWTIPEAKWKWSWNVVETRYRGGGMDVRRGGALGVRGGAARRGHGAVVRRGGAWGYRGGSAVVRRGGAVVGGRPANYWWPAGGAIAAGAAIGVVTAATAAAWAGAAPAPGYCWYYTDPSRRQGFWDVCR